MNTQNYGQWIDVEKDLLLVKPRIIYFVNNLLVVLIKTVEKISYFYNVLKKFKNVWPEGIGILITALKSL